MTLVSDLACHSSWRGHAVAQETQIEWCLVQTRQTMQGEWSSSQAVLGQQEYSLQVQQKHVNYQQTAVPTYIDVSFEWYLLQTSLSQMLEKTLYVIWQAISSFFPTSSCKQSFSEYIASVVSCDLGAELLVVHADFYSFFFLLST